MSATKSVVVVAMGAAMLVLGACSDEPATDGSTTTPSEEAVPSTTTPSRDVVDAPVPQSWLEGTLTCEELQGNVPDDVDDFSLALEDGIVAYSWGEDQSASVQFVDDPSCTTDSDAWKFLIAPILDPSSLYRSAHLCGFYQYLQALSPAPGNADNVLAALVEAGDLCG